MKVEIISHLYTTDFYQQSAFNPDHQIISIYYYVRALEEITVPLRLQPFEFDAQQMRIYEETGETETFRFVDWDDFSEGAVTLPIDKIVAKIVKENYS